MASEPARARAMMLRGLRRLPGPNYAQPGPPHPVAPYRASFQIVMGHGSERWQFPDPGHDLVERAQRHVRYGRSLGGGGNKALVLADVASALSYLIYDCPSTKLACEKLAQMRAAVRKLGPVESKDE